MAARFHSRGGSMITLSNNGRTAQRNHPAQEFNNGVVISAEPLRDNQLFEVKIDRKVSSWSGSIEVGVTSCDPNNLVLPTSATGFREGTWVMSGCSVMRDGHTTLDEYGQDLDQLAEGDRVGVMRTAGGVLHIYVNGVDQGPAATGIPVPVWAVVDLYGKCAQVSVVIDTVREPALCDYFVPGILSLMNPENIASTLATNLAPADHLVFHERCGTLVKLSNGRRTAERQRPLDEFNNGVVMTARPLHNDERFEIRLDRLVDKWSGSIEVGITTHNPNTLEFPATMTNMRSGRQILSACTIMMSGSGILTNGKGTRREYGEFNLDELQEGDRIGLVRKSSGALHYFINGVDQGVATSKAPQTVWGVVDLYGMAVKVTIIDVPADVAGSSSNHDNNITNDASILYRQLCDTLNACRELDDRISAADPLLFHPRCGSHAAVINGQRTAHRPHAVDDFNNAVVLTVRPLKPNEMFEVRIDKMVDKWAGSIEIGVTTHSPLELEFPSTMTNVRSGTWMMTGNGVMHNGMTVHEEYGLNLDRLKVGDRVGVMRKEDGTLNFFVNGTDQGPATSGVPANVYGVIDLYGQAAQATIVDTRDTLTLPEIEVSQAVNMAADYVPIVISSELQFHRRHGRNASVSADGRTAWRSSARGEFNDAIVVSSRALRDNELFEVRVDRMIERWSGSLEVGVTLIKPDELEFPNTMTDMDFGTWMLSGSSVMQNGTTIRSNYQLDLDVLHTGSRIGVMRRSDGNLHYFLDTVDQGSAFSNVPPGVYAVIDLYGQCCQVSIAGAEDGLTSTAAGPPGIAVTVDGADQSTPSPLTPGVSHRFGRFAGKNVTLKNSNCSASRAHNSYDHGLVFSSEPLRPDELFEVQIDSVTKKWSGSLQIGLTTLAASHSSTKTHLPASAIELRSKSTWIVTRSEVRRNGTVVCENYCPSLECLDVEDRVGIKRAADGTMHLYINGCDIGVAASGIPKNVFAIVDIYGRVESLSVTSTVNAEMSRSVSDTPVNSNSQTQDAASDVITAFVNQNTVPVEHATEDNSDVNEAAKNCVEFHMSLHGKNVLLGDDRKSAERMASYNQALVLSRHPLLPGHLFKVQICQINERWSASLVIGVVSLPNDKWSLPNMALDIHRPSWLIHADSIYHNGAKVKQHGGPNLDGLAAGHSVGILIKADLSLHLFVDDRDCGVIARDVNLTRCHVVVDLYGRCERISIVADGEPSDVITSPVREHREKADKENGQKEKHMPRLPLEAFSITNSCEYQRMCTRFRTLLGLPDGYFNMESSCCYCETCHKLRGDAPYYRRGEPPKDYAVPVGWCKFPLRLMLKPDAQHSTAFDKWHVAYHGTTASVVRRLLDTGDLLSVSDSSLVGGKNSRSLLGHFDEKNKPEEQVITEPVVLSPSIKYAGSGRFTTRLEYRDPKTRKLHQASIAIQVCVKPGSYKVGTAHSSDPDVAEAVEQIDAKFSNNELEWSTKERGSTTLCALLVRID